MIDNFTFYDLIGQAIGILASAMVVSSYMHKKDNSLKLFMVLANFTFGIHFFMLDASAGMLIAFLNCFRIGLSIKFHKSYYMMAFMMSIYIIFGYIAAENFIDWLPIISSLIGTFSMYMLSGIKFRLMGLFGSTAWLTYSIIFVSIGGVLTEVFAIGFNVYTMLKLRKTT